ncbi:MAG TPA: tetratricopeptide repeat protein [Gemmataceae bacterium]|nr:tetratricopeptide repeat protein [Gemmataceae bacterium]
MFGPDDPFGGPPWHVRLAWAVGGVCSALLYNFGLVLELPLRGAQALLSWGRERLGGVPWRGLVQGLPALLVGATVLVLVVARLAGAMASPAPFYRQRAADAASRGDFPTARLCLERLDQVGGADNALVQSVAACADATGHARYARGLYNRLAPLDRQGAPAAHVRQAQFLLEPGNTPDALAHAEVHLRRALKADPDLPAARFLLANVCARTGRAREAIDWLRPLAVKQPDVYLLMARLHLSLGDAARARDVARAALEHFRRRAEADVDDRDSRLAAAEAAAYAEEYSLALDLLRGSLARDGGEKERRAAAGVYAAWAAKVEKDGAEPAFVLGLVQQGLAHDPTNEALLWRLVAFTHRTGEQADKARAELRRVVADGRGAAAEFLLGTDAWMDGRRDEGRRLMERALALAPQIAPVANNMAWMLAHEEKPDLPRALALVEAALDRAPDRPYLRDTRGYILLKMGRPKDALADLQAAQAALGNDRERHQALAEAYERLGEPELAAEHRRRAAAKR